MTISMLTVDRAALGGVNYIQRTLESFRQEFPTAALDLFVGNQETDYLYETFRSEFRVFTPPILTFASLIEKPKRYLGSRNYCRALAAVEEGESLLLLEDDIIFTVRFPEKLRQRIEAIPVEVFVLSLFTVRTLHHQPVAQLDPLTFTGTQALYFPPSVIPLLRDFFRQRLAAWTPDTPENDISHDLMIGQWCEQTGTPLYASYPSLVNHIGNTSAVIDTRTATSCMQAAAFHMGTPRPHTLAPVESFCAFGTMRYASELALLLKSVALFHPGIPVYVVTDPLAATVLTPAHPNVVFIIGADPLQLRTLFQEYDSHPGSRSRADQNRGGLYLLKMQAITAALEKHSNTVYLDGDIILTAPFEPQPPCDAAMALHWFDPLQPELEKACGHFNAGLLWVASREFVRWWRTAYLNFGFADQGCLSQAPELFDVHILSLAYNFGWWRLWNHAGGCRIDLEHATDAEVAAFCGLTAGRDGIRLHGQTLQSFHVHMLAKMPKPDGTRAALQRLVAHVLAYSADPRHAELGQLINTASAAPPADSRSRA